MIWVLIVFTIFFDILFVGGLFQLFEGKNPFGYLPVSMGILGLTFLLIIPWYANEKDYYSLNISKYFQITKQDDGGYLVVNLNSMETHKEYDVRFIKAANDGKLYVHQIYSFDSNWKTTEITTELEY